MIEFKNKLMALKAASAYQGEEDRQWMVVSRTADFGGKSYEYKPILVADCNNDAKRAGWFISE